MFWSESGSHGLARTRLNLSTLPVILSSFASADTRNTKLHVIMLHGSHDNKVLINHDSMITCEEYIEQVKYELYYRNGLAKRRGR